MHGGMNVKYVVVARAFCWVHWSQERSARSNQRRGQVPVVGWSESSLQLTCEENLATSICVESKEEKGTGERACEKLREQEIRISLQAHDWLPLQPLHVLDPLMDAQE